MTYVKNNNYRDIPFCANTPYNDFYIYSNLKEIPDKCNDSMEEMMRCRTIGILQSLSGRFFLSDIEVIGAHTEPQVQVSMVYLKSPPQSTVVPYPVQVFGVLQWKHRPVIFAHILQVLSVSTAIRLKNALSGITSIHLARNVPESETEDELRLECM